jgi:Zn-dependent peptidase ImmA (M78 family)/mRNA-degrading endonuclease RelE of RelBE toxin-antitoxin system
VNVNAEAEGRDAAARFRRDHRVGVQPLGDLVAVIEQATGIDVAVLDVGPDEHGLTMRDPRRNAVFIGVARTGSPMRQRSTLAHELGHVIFEDWVADGNNWGDRRPEEIRADAFARHLLVPVDGLREFLGSATAVTQAVLSAVVQRFLVSPAIAAIALHEAGYIDADIKRNWIGTPTRYLAVRYGWGDQYLALQADSDRRRAPQRLLARAIKGYAEGVLSAQAIATRSCCRVDQAGQHAEAVAAAAYEFMTGPLLTEPYRAGKRLMSPLDDRFSTRRGTYRVTYRVDEDKRIVTVVDVDHRRDVYRV